MTRARNMTFTVPPGCIPDMVCGGAVDGVETYPGQKKFRPEYYSVVFTDGHMKELRLWGTNIKKDGTLGNDVLDYWWRWSKPSEEVAD